MLQIFADISLKKFFLQKEAWGYQKKEKKKGKERDDKKKIKERWD